MMVEQNFELYWIVTSCRPAEVRRRYGGSYCPHVRRRRVSLADCLSCALLYAGALPGLLVHREYGSGMFLRNVCEILPNDTA
jgi:hypothetical protein